jgi:hypothetical protein
MHRVPYSHQRIRKKENAKTRERQERTGANPERTTTRTLAAQRHVTCPSFVSPSRLMFSRI